jgi:hypothetical protein
VLQLWILKMRQDPGCMAPMTNRCCPNSHGAKKPGVRVQLLQLHMRNCRSIKATFWLPSQAGAWSTCNGCRLHLSVVCTACSRSMQFTAVEAAALRCVWLLSYYITKYCCDILQNPCQILLEFP